MSVYIKYLNIEDSFSEPFATALMALFNQVLAEHDLEQAEVGVIITDNKELCELNRNYRGRNAATDVLSFSYLEPGVLPSADEGDHAIGDIYISEEKALQQAEEADHSFEREVALLAIHGLLHLLGFEHDRDGDFELMQRKEKALLARFDQLCSGGDN